MVNTIFRTKINTYNSSYAQSLSAGLMSLSSYTIILFKSLNFIHILQILHVYCMSTYNFCAQCFSLSRVVNRLSLSLLCCLKWFQFSKTLFHLFNRALSIWIVLLSRRCQCTLVPIMGGKGKLHIQYLLQNTTAASNRP